MTDAPKYARPEFERRFRVIAESLPPYDKAAARLIEDRYIDGSRLRLRRMSGGDRDELFKLTRKYGGPLPEPIATLYLTVGEYRLLCGLPAAILRKRRYHLPVGDVWFSLDVFEGRLAGLMLCEVEAESAAALAAIAPPEWAGEEITGDPGLTGAALARGH